MSIKVSNVTSPIYLHSSYDRDNSPKRKLADKKFILSTHNNLKPQKRSGEYNVVQFDQRSMLFPIQYMEKYVNANVISHALKTNPNITKILNEHGIIPRISEINIDERAKMHMFTTYLYAKDLAEHVKLAPQKANTLYQAALLHDIGKALIPEKIIQKPDKLTHNERTIVDLHSELGYEILRTTDVSQDVLEAVRTHHTDTKNPQKNIVSQILSVVDVFSALKEERVYKQAMTDDKAFEIMTSSPKLSQFLVMNLNNIRNNKS